MKESKQPIVDIQWSHGRPRTEIRRPVDGGTPALPPPSETANAAPQQDKKSGRFLPGNQVGRKRRLLKKAKGVHTLNPQNVESWLQPHVQVGVEEGIKLLETFPQEVLSSLVGATADALVVYRALLALAGKGGPDGMSEFLPEARQWLKEYRACLRELSALSALARQEAEASMKHEGFLDIATEPGNEDSST